MREFLTGTDYELISTKTMVHFQNVGKGTLVIKRALTQPSAETPGWLYPQWIGERGHVDALYPTETGDLWARSEESTKVLVEEI